MQKYFSKDNRREEGVALVVSLLVLSLIVASAVALSRVIINEVRMSVNTGNSIIAYYSADSGMEKALYAIKYARENSDFSDFLALDDGYPNNEEQIDGTDQEFSYSQSIIDATGHTSYEVSTSSPAYIDIIDPSGDLSGLPWNGPAPTFYRYDVAWVIEDCFPYHSSDKMEVSYTAFDGSSFGGSLPEVTKRVVLCNCVYGSDECQADLSSYLISNEKYYRFMLRPLDSVAESLDFNIYLAITPTVPVGILSETSISVEGSYHNSAYTISARLPALVPVSHAFNYVVFSEEPIVKDL